MTLSKLSDFFIQKALALCEKYNVDVNIIQYDDERDAYLALVEAGIDQDDIINFFESAINLTFVDVREKPLCISAIKNDIASMSLKEGASTLTQQLIKNMMLTNTKSLERKIQEMYLSYKIEKLYNKKEIIEFYCNFVSFDGYSHGVLSASYKFFNKHVKHLTLPEAA